MTTPRTMQALQLLVGLGNPGQQYQDTLHNAGHWLLQRFIEQHQIALKTDRSLNAAIGRYPYAASSCRIALSRTYMNNSGQAVQRLIRFYQIPIATVLIVHDDIDLMPGVLKLKFDGGAGGHNGLRDIIQKLGQTGFWRLRIGVGHPGHRDRVHSYVLSRGPTAQRSIIDQAINEGANELETIIKGDFQAAMQRLAHLSL